MDLFCQNKPYPITFSIFAARQPLGCRAACFRYTIKSKICLFVCLFVCLSFRTNEMAIKNKKKFSVGFVVFLNQRHIDTNLVCFFVPTNEMNLAALFCDWIAKRSS